jgi:TonB family protein
MALRCLLFTSDEGTAQSVRQALTDLGVESEHCAVAVEAVEKVTNHLFNLLIVDWDNQTEAAFLLKAARERKASERPLTLAIVSRDLNVSQALQAGANSILRKPIVVAQVRDSLTSARDLLRSRQDASMAAAAAGSAGAALPRDPDGSKKGLRAGEFLQSTTAPGTQFVTEADVQNKIEKTIEAAAVAHLDPLKDLEPVAAAVESKDVVLPPRSSSPAEPRGLAWYLKARAASSPAAAPAAPAERELLGNDQPAARGETHKETVGNLNEAPAASANAANPGADPQANSDQKSESALFAYMSGESSSASKGAVARSLPWLHPLILSGALIAACTVAYVTVPPERWRQMQILAANGVHVAHNWLNPQTPTPTQVPTTHENFGLAGDEYKLPVAQNIPDATTDPTQIRVVPVVDPTAKRPNGADSNAGQTTDDTTSTDNSTGNSAQNSSDQPQAPVQVQESAQPGAASPVVGEASSSSTPPALPNVALEPGEANKPAPNATPVRRAPVQPVSAANSRPQAAPTTTSTKPHAGIPSSLKSQMASMTPDASGNKPVEASLPSIEPVDLPEATARGLLLEQPEPEYPAGARGQQGTVVLQVLIGRDGAVQDAKFLQGSLAFARVATDAVKQWRFKPYTLNGRPVSTKTVLTLTFKPAA